MFVKNKKDIAKKIVGLTTGIMFSGGLCYSIALMLDERFPRYVTVHVYDSDGNVENRYMRKRRFSR